MAVIFLVVFLYCIEDVREITLSALIFESWAMMSSVIPSLKYSFSGSVLMFSNGSTATDFAAGDLLHHRLRRPHRDGDRRRGAQRLGELGGRDEPVGRAVWPSPS